MQYMCYSAILDSIHTYMFVLQCIVEQITIQEHFELVVMGNTKAAYKWDEIRLVMQFG